MRHLLVAILIALAAQAQVTAQINWTVNPANGHAYALTAPMGWAAAEAHASTQGAHLVTIRSAAEQTWIYQTFGTVGFWIGFSDAATEGTWTWTSGESPTYTNWCPGEPNNASNEDFSNLSGCGGWNDVEDTVLLPGIMERPASPPLWVQNPGNGRYYTLSAPLPWDQAEILAVALGGHLATVRTAAEHAWLAQAFGTHAPSDTRLWIGLNDEAVEGVWTWTSGEPFTYSNWGLFEPDNAGNQDSGALWLLPGGGWAWSDDQGSNAHPAIIEVETPSPTARYTSYGTGCLGPNGLAPSLTAVPGELPRPGTTSHLRVTNLPPVVTIPVFVVGFSDAWDPDGYPIPLDLSILGWNGCTQLVSDEILYWEITTSGQSDQAITVPANLPLGFTFYVQVLVLYAPTGVALSNAITGVVGF